MVRKYRTAIEVTQPFRLNQGGVINRDAPCTFTFDGQSCGGYQGDTLASALLANGIRLVGRSFKLHRPRGILASGVEEPNALIQLASGAFTEPNTKATQIELYDGLVSESQNRWPSLRFDLGAGADLFHSLLPAGFYYKTFMWPSWAWFEPWIRRAAGLGRAPTLPDPARYQTRYDHADVLVIGAGPAGLASAAAALKRGKRVMLIEQQPILGGSLVDRQSTVALNKLNEELERAAQSGELVILKRATAIAVYDHRMVSVVERLTDHLSPARHIDQPRQRLRLIRAGCVVAATGAIERPLLFPNNDRPGIMLASAVLSYLNRFAVLAGRRAIVHGGADDVYETASALAQAGSQVTLVDLRAAPPAKLVEQTWQKGIELVVGHAISNTTGRAAVRSADIVSIRGGKTRRVPCDLVAMSGGWTPTTHLHSMAGGTLRFDDSLNSFVPDHSHPFFFSAGAAAGVLDLEAAIADGELVGDLAGLGRPHRPPPTPRGQGVPATPIPDAPSRTFVDFQNDVSVADIELASREGMRSVEHLKRYTTLGMAVDQGKTSNVNGISVLARVNRLPINEIGTTKFRPPYTPTAIGVFGGATRGDRFLARRDIPTLDWQASHGAELDDFGGSWKRPVLYPKAGEDETATVTREVSAVRNQAGLFESSPLGKIEVKGPDARVFVDRLYANSMKSLQPGRIRYGLMLNKEGVIIDDGVLTCLGPDHFLVGTTSAGSIRIAEWLEELHQCEWPQLEVAISPVTTAWSTATLTGPRARAVLELLETGVDLASFPHLSFRECKIGGVAARISRVSFTGEVSYEISVPWRYGASLWEKLMEVGGSLGLTSVGIEAWLILRLEKGYMHIGGDTDGTTLPDDVGWGAAAARKTDAYVGQRSLAFHAARNEIRLQLVGIEPAEPHDSLEVGTHLVETSEGRSTSVGVITSACNSPTLKKWIGMARLVNGRSRTGETIETYNLGTRRRVRITQANFYDPEGGRLRE